MLTEEHQTMPPFSGYLMFGPLFCLNLVRSFTHQTEPLHAPHNGEDQTLVVTCHEDSMEVLMRARLLGSRLAVELVGMRLGADGAAGGGCSTWLSSDGDFVIWAPLAGCGSRVMFTETEALYTNLLLLYFTPPSDGGAGRLEVAAVPVMCKHRRRFAVSSGALRPTWTPLVSIRSADLSLDFQLRLMTDDWSRERASPVFFMDQTVNMQASVDHHHPPPLHLYAGGCVATLTPDVNSHPAYPFIDRHGCFTDSRLSSSGSRFLPRIRDELLQIQLEPFFFHQDSRHTIYITCYLEAVIVSQKETKKKACSFINERWRSVDGDDNACESCNSADEFSHKGAQRSERSVGINDLHQGTTLGPIVFLPKRADSTENVT
nr:zona pellucida sperm-binding protein 3-like isoform X1 [Nothobranchius furzeri]